MQTAPENGSLSGAEDASRLSEERLRRAISIETVGVLFFRLDGRILDANPALQRMSGYTVEDLRGIDDWARLTPPEFADVTRRAATEVTERGTTAPYEKQWVRKDGSRFWGLFSPTRLSGSGIESECVEFIIDITEQKRAEAKVRESEVRQSFLLKLGDALRLLIDPVEIEETATRVLGEHLGANRVAYFEVRGTDYFIEHEYTNGAGALAGSYPTPLFGERLLVTYLSGQTVCSPDVTADATLPPEARAAYLNLGVGAYVGVPLIKGGKFVAGLAVHSTTPRDWKADEIALVEETAERTWAAVERAQAEAASRASEERLRALVAASSAVVYRMNADWSELLHLVGKNFIADMAGSNRAWLERYVHPNDQSRVLVTIREAIRTKSTFQVEHRIRLVDGTWGWTSSRAIPLLDSHGEIVEWFGAASDVTDRKQAEAALRESEERFRAAASAVSSLIWTNNAHGEMTGDQPGWNEFTGQSPEEYHGYGWARAVHPEDAQPTIDAWVRAVAEKRMFEFEHRVRRRDGEWRVCSVRAVPVMDENGGIREWVGVHNDITEQKQADEQLREGAERLHFMAESMPQKIFTARPDGTVDYFNSKWMEFTGLTFEQIRDWGWLQFIHPDDVQENIRRWKHSVETGEYFELEHRFRRRDGVYRWHLSRAHAMRDTAGAVTMWIGSNTDIDDQKRAEEGLEKTVAERTAKLREIIAELEAFSYSIAHDMRAPLRSLQGFSEVLLSDYADKLDAVGQSHLRRISKSAERMDKLIQDVLNYSRVVRGEWPLEAVDVEQLLRGIADTYPMLAPEKADIVIEGAFPTVLGSEAMLMQIFSNLLGNAAKFVSGGKKPQIRVWSVPSGERVRIFVRDNGIGIAREEHERIFGIFHQVGRAYEGTGIGLAIVKKAVERMNGIVGIESEIGQGTTFWVELQRA